MRYWWTLAIVVFGLAVSMRAVSTVQLWEREVELATGPYEGVFPVLDEPRFRKSAKDGSMRWVTLPTRAPDGKLNVIFESSVTNALPRLGERWRCAGWMTKRGHGGSGPRTLWVRGGSTFAVREAVTAQNSVRVVLGSIRRELSRRLGIGLDSDPLVADLHRAMLLGMRSSLPFSLRESFIEAGTFHVFAISGLHVAIVAGFLFGLLVLLAVPVRWVGLVIIPLLWAYVAMIGAPTSAIRAASMSSVYLLAPVFLRRPNSITAWEVTMLVFATIDPIGFFGVGSLLSFAVMAGILLFIRWAKMFSSRWVTALGVPFAAWAAGVPIAAHFFARVTPGGLLANLVVVPLAGMSVLTTAIGLFLGILSDRLAAYANNLAALFTRAMVGVSWAVSRLPGANFEVSRWGWLDFVLWYAAVILSLTLVRMIIIRRRRSLV